MKNKLLFISGCVYIIICASALVYYFPWLYTYEVLDYFDYTLAEIANTKPISKEYNETVRSPCWIDPGGIIRSNFTRVPGSKDNTFEIHLTSNMFFARRNWERFLGELIVAIACGFLIYRAGIFIYYKRKGSNSRQ